jgi:hypothetical protein
MTSATVREELLTALAELGRLFPDWRLGQTLANLAMAAGHAESGAVWDLEDSEALAAARRLIERNASRQQVVADVTMSFSAAAPESDVRGQGGGRHEMLTPGS